MLSLIQCILCFSQVNLYDVPARTQFIDTYVPLDFNFIMQAAATRQARYDQNSRYLYSLLGWISDIESQTKDQELEKKLHFIKLKLNSLKDEDLSLATSVLQNTELAIKQAVNEYNARVELNNKINQTWNEINNQYTAANYLGAIQSSTKLIELIPDQHHGYSYRALSYFALQEYDKAISDFEKAMSLNATDIKLKYYYGWSLAYSNRLETALQTANNLINQLPNSPDAYFLRGYILSGFERFNEANNDYKKTIELNPKHSMAYNNLGYNIFKGGGDLDQALSLVNKALELDTKNYYAWDSRGEIYLTLEKYKESIFSCEQAIKIKPDYSYSYLIKGQANYQLGMKTEACSDWEKAGELGEFKAFEFLEKYCH